MQNMPDRISRNRKRRIRWPRVFLLLVILVVLTAGTFRAGMYAYELLFPPRKNVAVATTDNKKINLPAEAISKRVNVLLLGTDDGEVDNPKSPKRSDTMIVASVNPDDKSIILLSIPRDTRVHIPGKNGYDKITHAYAYGGADLAKRTVEELLDIPIHYYMSMDWEGFIKIIDILGGVNLYVEHNMHYKDPYANLTIYLDQGYQHLDGKKAGQYIRFRSDELGDIGRVQRQMKFLKALSDETFQVGTILKLPSLVSVIKDYVSTDMNMFTMLKLANSVKTFTGGGVHTQMLPGKFGDIKGLSFWIPDDKQTKQIVDQLKT